MNSRCSTPAQPLTNLNHGKGDLRVRLRRFQALQVSGVPRAVLGGEHEAVLAHLRFDVGQLRPQRIELLLEPISPGPRASVGLHPFAQDASRLLDVLCGCKRDL